MLETEPTLHKNRSPFAGRDKSSVSVSISFLISWYPSMTRSVNAKNTHYFAKCKINYLFLQIVKRSFLEVLMLRHI